MDVKKRRGRKPKTSNGRMEEKPTVAEVTRQKEEHDRLEAASVLSSLIFLPPKESEDKNVSGKGSVSARKSDNQKSVAYISSNRSGISESTHHMRAHEKRLSRGRGGTSKTQVANCNPAIIAHLQSNNPKLLQSLSGSSKGSKALNQFVLSKLQSLKKESDDSESGNSGVKSLKSPLYLPPNFKQSKTEGSEQKSTVSKTVAQALRQAVESNLGRLAPNNEDIQSLPDMLLSSVEIANPDKKKENSETSLPLKKRRLLALKHDAGNNDLLSSEVLAKNTGNAIGSHSLESITKLASLSSGVVSDGAAKQSNGKHF